MKKSAAITSVSVFGLVAGIFMLGGEKDVSAMQMHHHMGGSHMHIMHVVNGQVHAHSHITDAVCTLDKHNRIDCKATIETTIEGAPMNF